MQSDYHRSLVLPCHLHQLGKKQRMQKISPRFDIKTSRRTCENLQRISCKSPGPTFLPTNRNMIDEKTITEFYAFLNPYIFKNILENAQKYLAFFGSTYICETAFSLMKITKSKIRSRITDENLEETLQIATSEFNPNFNEIRNQEHSKFNPSH